MRDAPDSTVRNILRTVEGTGTMAISEARRSALFASARRVIGDEEAETLMGLMVPAGAEIATRSFVLTTVLSVTTAQTALTVSLILLLQG